MDFLTVDLKYLSSEYIMSVSLITNAPVKGEIDIYANNLHTTGNGHFVPIIQNQTAGTVVSNTSITYLQSNNNVNCMFYADVTTTGAGSFEIQLPIAATTVLQFRSQFPGFSFIAGINQVSDLSTSSPASNNFIKINIPAVLAVAQPVVTTINYSIL